GALAPQAEIARRPVDRLLAPMPRQLLPRRVHRQRDAVLPAADRDRFRAGLEQRLVLALRLLRALLELPRFGNVERRDDEVRLAVEIHPAAGQHQLDAPAVLAHDAERMAVDVLAGERLLAERLGRLWIDRPRDVGGERADR